MQRKLPDSRQPPWLESDGVFFGGFGCTLKALVLRYVPLWHHSYTMGLIDGMVCGAIPSGYVPLSALMPNLPCSTGAEAS